MAKNKSITGMILGIGAGVAAAAASCVAAIKIFQEIKTDNQETTMISPNEKNFVTVTCGSSRFANGLTRINVKAENENNNCELSFLAGKDADQISFSWADDDHFSFHLGEGKSIKCCDVSFEDDNIEIKHYVKKN